MGRRLNYPTCHTVGQLFAHDGSIIHPHVGQFSRLSKCDPTACCTDVNPTISQPFHKLPLMRQLCAIGHYNSDVSCILMSTWVSKKNLLFYLSKSTSFYKILAKVDINKDLIKWSPYRKVADSFILKRISKCAHSCFSLSYCLTIIKSIILFLSCISITSPFHLFRRLSLL